MQIAPKPSNENSRLAFLQSLELLDSKPEERFDCITRLACKLLGARYAAVSLVDRDRQWFLSKCGLDVSSTSRDVSFCAHTILEDRIFAVENALEDPRFLDNPLVLRGPKLQAYLGHPLAVSGVPVGALCVLYTEARTFSEQDRSELSDLAHLVEEAIEYSQFRREVGQGFDEALRVSDVVLRRALHLNSEPSALIQVKTGAVTDLNQACIDEIGCSKQDISGKPIPVKMLMSEAELEELRARLELCQQIKDVEVTAQLGQRDPCQLLCSAEVVFYKGEEHVLIVGRDVSHLRMREVLLREALRATGTRTGKAYFSACARVIAEQLGVRYGVLLALPRGATCDAEVIGYWDCLTQESVLSRSLLDGPPREMRASGLPIHRPHSARATFPSSESLRALDVESYYGHPVISNDGAVGGYLLVMDTKPFQDESGKAALLLGSLSARTAGELGRLEMLQDLEEARQRAEVASLAKGNFLANMSHELRTPMNAILGFSQLMAQDKDQPERHRETLKIINQSGEHLLGLINNVLEMTKIEAGQTDIEAEETDIAYLVRGVESMLSESAREKGIELSMNVEANVPPYVVLDQGKTRQILVNLVSNAIKFTEAGKVALDLSVMQGDGSQSLQFDISDTGRGISPDAVSRLFQPFEQLDRNKGLEGTGLGLSICKGYVRSMGGAMGVSSKPGIGSVFHLTLPMVLVHRDRTAHSSVLPVHRGLTLDQGPRSDLAETRILIVDDIAPGRLLLRRLIEPLGFSIREATNGQAALDAEEEWRPSLIFMDLRMPVMDGDEASSIIRKRRNRGCPAIIAITASVFRDNLQGADNLFDDFITKPFRIEELMAKLEYHLAQHALAS